MLLGTGCDSLFGLRELHGRFDAPTSDGRSDGPPMPTNDSGSLDVPLGVCSPTGLMCANAAHTFMTASGGCYAECADLVSQAQAQMRCRDWGGDLPVLDTPEEDLAVTGTISNGGHWIGIQQMQTAGSLTSGWVWITGYSVNNARWYNGEPNDGADNAENHQEDCGWALAGGWGDYSCTVTAYILCER